MKEYRQTGSGPANQTTPDRRSLAELEDIIAKGKATLIEVGEALIAIHTRKLYRQDGFKNFKTYLAERWGISRAHGYRAIAAAKLPKTEMSPNETKSETETQARKPAKEKRSKPSQPFTVVKDLDVEAEFTAFNERVTLWEVEFSREDYVILIGKVNKYTNDVLTEAGYTDNIIIDQPEVEEVSA